ncbi:TPA: pyridine nucleotide-disulfide oxidoreductase [Klebsiella pneumoniae]|nr:pyridine nucleotide-disulfide oxidoreductase [Klebsiella pneumoniae]
MNGARLNARPSAHSVLFETADGGGVVYWQKLILCCSAGGASPRPSTAPSGWRSR